MTSRMTISIAESAPNNVLIKGGPTSAIVTMKPGETRVLDVISGFAFSVEEGGPAMPRGPIAPETTGKTQLQGS